MEDDLTCLCGWEGTSEAAWEAHQLDPDSCTEYLEAQAAAEAADLGLSEEDAQYLGC